jgi:hypothetical protein
MVEHTVLHATGRGACLRFLARDALVATAGRR